MMLFAPVCAYTPLYASIRPCTLQYALERPCLRLSALFSHTLCKQLDFKVLFYSRFL